jgi:hypothetical protein
MVVAIQAPTCWGLQRWAVFSLSRGTWQLVLDRPGFIHPLVAVGSNLRETAPVYRPGDARCLPSGGKHARLWHWDGTRFVAGPWKQVGRPPAPSSGYFKTPSGNIVCGYSPSHVGCRIKSGLKPPPPPRRPGCTTTNDVFLGTTGRTRTGRSVCPGEPEGDAGVLAYESVARPLAYGTTWSAGGLRCASALTGLTCRNASGHGFFLSRASWRRF